jgi:hypothetical protein
MNNLFGRDTQGFEILNHAIRMGTANEILRRSDLLYSNPGLLALAQQAQQQQQISQQQQQQLSQQQQHAVQPLQQPSLPAVQAQTQVQALVQTTDVSNRHGINSSFQFPWKLHDMLDYADANGIQHIVAWQDDGRSFKVHKPAKFVIAIMPQFFKQTKYKSFQRQLNLYGFNRINEGPRKGSYTHKSFLKGNRSLCQFITRTCEDRRVTERRTARDTKFAAVSINSVDASDEASEQDTNINTNKNCEYPTVSSDDSIKCEPTASSSGSGGSQEGGSADMRLSKEFQFPCRVHDMLARSVMDGFECIVSWQPGNDEGFKVHDPEMFVGIVMPLFFKQTKYKSFQRQLNLYGFNRVDEGPNKGSYTHKFFVRNQRGLCKRMARQRVKEGPDESPDPKQAGIRKSDMEDESSNNMVVVDTSMVSASISPDTSATASVSESVHDCSVRVPSDDKSQDLSWRQSPAVSFSDWTIQVVRKRSGSKDIYHVHRRVLAVGPRRSEYFASLFQSSAQKRSSNNSRLDLAEAEADIFDMVLDYMYSDSYEPKLTTETAFAVYSLAETLEIQHLMQAVTEFHRQKMTKSNLVDFMALSKNYKDTTLFDAVVEKCAEEIRSLDKEFAAQIEPQHLLKVLLKCKTLPRSYKCGSSRLSQLVAECLVAQFPKYTPEIFYNLTDREHLPFIDPNAAVKILSVQGKLFLTNQNQSVHKGSKCLHDRCIISITKNWSELREQIESDRSLAECLTHIPSTVLAEVLMTTTAAPTSEE